MNLYVSLKQVVAVLCMIFFSPPLTWFTRILCAVVAICFAVTIFVCLFYLFTLRRVVFPSWPWLKIVSRRPINMISERSLIYKTSTNIYFSLREIIHQETLFTILAAVSYLIASLSQLIFTNKEEYRIALTYHDYYHDYLVAGVSKTKSN